MKQVKVEFKIVKYGSVTLNVEDDYSDLDIPQQAENEYTEGDLYCGGDDFEVTHYEEV